MTKIRESDSPPEPTNLRELMDYRVFETPGQPFLFSEVDGREYAYGDFSNAVHAAGQLLLSHGVRKGDVVSLLMPNSAEYIIAYFACWILGALAGPVNSLLKSQELAYVIQNSEARALLLHSDFLESVNAIKSELPALRAVITFDDEA